MKKLLNWKSREVVNIFDEVTLWSAPFGRLLLENIPMFPKAQIVDIGFGTGFPLIELSQRFGEPSIIYGVEIWKEGISRAKEKISTLDINNIEIIEESATKMSISDHQIDLVTSNLGVNNFDDKELVYLEINRILKQGGTLAITTNPIGTFKELFEIFNAIFGEANLEEEQQKLKKHIEHRNNKQGLISEIEKYGFRLVKTISDTTNLRFVDSVAILNHSLIRIGFREVWENMIGEENINEFFSRLVDKITDIIDTEGEFIMTIPMLYLEFEKIA